MKVIYLAILVWILIMNLAIAGERTGNGGDVLVCKDETVLLDYYEAQFRGAEKFLEGKSIRDTYMQMLWRLNQLDPILSSEVHKIGSRLLYDVERYEITNIRHQKFSVFTDEELSDINDSNEVIIPRGCVKKQLIVNTLQNFRLAKRFVINTELWNKLDVNQKAYTVFHEAIYDSLTNYGAQNSILARYLTGILMSDLQTKYSLAYYIEDLSSLPSYRYRINFASFDLFERQLIIYAERNEITNCSYWVHEALRNYNQGDTCLILEPLAAQTFLVNSIYHLSNFIIEDTIALLPMSAIVDSKGRPLYYMASPLHYNSGVYKPVHNLQLGNLKFEEINPDYDWQKIIKLQNGFFDVYTAYPVILVDYKGKILFVRYRGQTYEVAP